MGLFDFLKKEADDLGDVAESARKKFDEELTRRENELNMTPSEKIAALQRQAESSDARFDEIASKAAGQNAGELPNITHIVLPDGQVKSGDHAPGRIVDEKGHVHEVPPVIAPTAEELEQLDQPAVSAPTAQTIAPEPPAPEPPANPAVSAAYSPASADPSRPRDDVAAIYRDPLLNSSSVGPSSGPAPSAPEDSGVIYRDPIIAKPSNPPTSPVPVVAERVDAARPEPVIPGLKPPAAIEAAAPDPIPETPTVKPSVEIPSAADEFEELLQSLGMERAEPVDHMVHSDADAALDDLLIEDFGLLDQSSAPAESEPDVWTRAEPEPSRVEPPLVEQAEPSRVEPSLVEQSEPSRVEPSGVEPSLDEQSEPAESQPESSPPEAPSKANYGKTAAQIKYEQARASANDLLEELRGELKAEGEI